MLNRVDFQVKFIFFILFLVVGLSSFVKDSVTMFDCTGIIPSYNIDVNPILSASCALSGCPDAFPPNAGYAGTNPSIVVGIIDADGPR